MIPRVIHYCWFGGAQLPEPAQKCIESWRRFLPDCEIREWSEGNFDVRCCDYVNGAYEAGKWAFVSDYARFKILYEHGGIYFDTDVELIRPIDDILDQGPFMGLELDPYSVKKKHMAAPGLGMAAIPTMGIYREILEDYEKSSFFDADGGISGGNVVQRVTGILARHGFCTRDELQDVSGIRIYPSDYFDPKDFVTGEIKITGNTRSIHHYDASWHGEKEREVRRVASFLMGKGTLGRAAFKAVNLLLLLKHKAREVGIIETARFSMGRVRRMLARIIQKRLGGA